MSTQPEQVLENQLVEQLSHQGYAKVSIPDCLLYTSPSPRDS